MTRIASVMNHVVDALLGKKEEAIVEAKRAAEMLPVSGDAEMGPGFLATWLQFTPGPVRATWQ
jgi:hypothetical protein